MVIKASSCRNKAWFLMGLFLSGRNSLALNTSFYIQILRKKKGYSITSPLHVSLLQFSLQTGSGQVQQPDSHFASFVALFSGGNWRIIKAGPLH